MIFWIMIARRNMRVTHGSIQNARLPFTGSHCPTGDDEERQDEDQQDCAGTNGHQCFQDESRVELDSIECSNTSRRRILTEAKTVVRTKETMINNSPVNNLLCKSITRQIR